MSIKRTVHISIAVEVTAYEDRSGMSEKDLASRVYDLVLEQRNELAAAARIAAYELLDGNKPISGRDL